jgi:transposase
LYRQQEKSVHAVARELGIHRSVVTRVIKKYEMERDEGGTRKGRKRCRNTDGYESFIIRILEQTPTISAVGLFRKAVQHGYQGGESQFRQRVAELRGSRSPEAFLHLQILPGEVLQVDWAEFGIIPVTGGTRKLYGAVFVLAYSRAIHVTFSFDCKTSTLLAAQSKAFAWFGGVTHTCLYDNMKSVVLHRPSTRTAVYSEAMLQYAKHYNFKVRVTGVRKPQHKGRVERAIRYLKGSFYGVTDWKDLQELNAKALAWCETVALERKWPDNKTVTVADKLAEEKQSLHSLPATDYPCVETLQGRTTRKTHYLHFDSNQYSIPPEGVGKMLAIVATVEQVRIVDGTRLLAQHRRSYNKGQKITDSTHVQSILKTKHAAGRDALVHLLVTQVPEMQQFIERLREYGQFRAKTLNSISQLLELYGEYEFGKAVSNTMASKQRRDLHPQLVSHLESSRKNQGLAPLLPLNHKERH